MSRLADKIEIVPARASHVWAVARRMRQADRDEAAALSGLTPLEALRKSFRMSDKAFTVLVAGKPEIMFGHADVNVLGGIICVWLVGSDAIVKHGVWFTRESADWRDQLLQRYAFIRNFVHVRNTVHVRWLRHLGATFSDPITINGHEFKMFEMRAKQCV